MKDEDSETRKREQRLIAFTRSVRYFVLTSSAGILHTKHKVHKPTRYLLSSNAKLAISPKPWLELLNQTENPFVRGSFLHVALAGTISKANCELDREDGDFRVRASIPSASRVRKDDGSNVWSTSS